MGSIIKTSNLTDVKPYKTSWSVQVKVLHMWKSCNPQLGSSLELVLSDENGVKIHATCKDPFIERVENLCRVGEWIIIKNFSLSHASGFDRVTDHIYRMSFVCQTTISESLLQCHNMFLDLKAFDTVLSGSLNTNFLIDVIGEVLEYGGIDVLQCQRKEIKKVEFTLRDINDKRIKCCLWGKCAELLASEANVPTNGDICLIRFAKIVKIKGELHVSNSFDSSLVLLNPDIAETHALKQMFHEEGNSGIPFNIQPAKITVQGKRMKWSQIPFKTIQEMKRTEKGGYSRVICTVYAIDTTFGWYYCVCLLCNHEAKRMPVSYNDRDMAEWWCECCNRPVKKVSPRYKLHLLVQDLTGESNLILLDSAAKTIVNASAAKFLNGASNKFEDPEVLPGEIVQIVGKSYGFGISLENNDVNGSENFDTVKVWNLDDILWKRIKSLHQLSVGKKKQCITHTENEKVSHDEAKVKKSG